MLHCADLQKRIPNEMVPPYLQNGVKCLVSVFILYPFFLFFVFCLLFGMYCLVFLHLKLFSLVSHPGHHWAQDSRVKGAYLEDEVGTLAAPKNASEERAPNLRPHLIVGVQLQEFALGAGVEDIGMRAEREAASV